jgi:rubrerythrin
MDEIDHEKIFAEMAEQLACEEHKVTLFEPVTEVADYLATLADSKVFNLSSDFSSQLTGKETVADVLKIALDKEKDSIVFYLGLRDYVPVQAGRDTVDVVLRQELEHVNVLTHQLEQCK